MSTPRARLSVARLLTLCLLINCYVIGQAQQAELHSRGTVLGNDAQYSFPEKIIVGPLGDLYILDTELANVFQINMRNGNVSRLCKPGALNAVADLAVGARGDLWALDAYRSKVLRLDRQCAVQSSFAVQHTPMRVHVNAFGELTVLTGGGGALFDVYAADGKLIRSFGKRNVYGDPIADNELSDGHLVPDAAGGFYFSFNYPPLIQHYSRDGRLLGEFKPESDIAIGSPNVSSRRQGNQLIVSSKYQLLVLDMATDRRGRLYLLLSGKDKIPALTQGSRKLLVVSDRGKTLAKYDVKEDAFHRVAVGAGNLYLLRNRRALRLEMYALP